MSVDRPTFSESWHRVAALRPRLRASVQTYRQQFRGRTWHVIADPSNNQHFRLDESAYRLIALLDGRRTVAESWKITNEQLGDAAPTQEEVIRLLGQLYVSNLLRTELPADAEQMFERHRKRVRREVGGFLMNFMFARIPLFDPQRILQRWEPVFGWLFGPVGLLLWCAVISTGLYALTGHWSELWQRADPQVLLATDNLLWLYICFVVIKACHEFGHGFACAHFGKRNGTGGPVHTIGVMLLVFMPVPYVDASSSWVFRNKWHRAFVGAAGMYVELMIASAAAIIWARTGENTLTHTLAFNTIFIASVSTLLFNGNPLLRYDGYYILSDLLEMANLAERSRQYLYYLVRHYLYGVLRAQSPAHTRGERLWLAIYAVAATIYRVLVCVGIVLYVADKLFIIGVLMALGAIVTWGLIPLGKFVRYLATGPELERVRGRAVGLTLIVAAALFIGLGVVRFPDRARAEGIVEPERLAMVYMPEDGWIDTVASSGAQVQSKQTVLVAARNPQLESQREQTIAEIRGATTRRDLARQEDPAVTLALTDQITAMQQHRQRLDQELASLQMQADFDGVWFSPDADRLTGSYLKRGKPLGMIADLDHLIIRATADQSLGPRIKKSSIVEVRVKGRPDLAMTGEIERVLPAGQQDLPSEALGYMAGGTMAVSMDDRTGRKTKEPFFEIHIRPGTDAPPLWSGQRVIVRFTLGRSPLVVQWWRSIRQLVQRRFSIQL